MYRINVRSKTHGQKNSGSKCTRSKRAQIKVQGTNVQTKVENSGNSPPPLPFLFFLSVFTSLKDFPVMERDLPGKNILRVFFS